MGNGCATAHESEESRRGGGGADGKPRRRASSGAAARRVPGYLALAIAAPSAPRKLRSAADAATFGYAPPTALQLAQRCLAFARWHGRGGARDDGALLVQRLDPDVSACVEAALAALGLALPPDFDAALYRMDRPSAEAEVEQAAQIVARWPSAGVASAGPGASRERPIGPGGRVPSYTTSHIQLIIKLSI
jgi:hypothetical protein